MSVFPAEYLVRRAFHSAGFNSNQWPALRFHDFCCSWWLYVFRRHEESAGATTDHREQQITLQIWFEAVGHPQPFSESCWIGSVQNAQLIDLAIPPFL